MLEYIKEVRPVVYEQPLLVSSKPEPLQDPPVKLSQHAIEEANRRKEDRELLGQLSKYYRLRPGEGQCSGVDNIKMWEGPALLKEGKPGPAYSFHRLHSTHSVAPLSVMDDMELRFPDVRPPTGQAP